MGFEQFKEEMNKFLDIIKLTLNDEQIISFYKYMNLLIEKNKVMNLTAITDPEEIIIKHFMDSLTISKYLEDNSKIIDVGTGAGFPGIPVKMQNDTLEICLLDSLNKRINFLQEVINENKINKIKAIHGRAEDFGQNREYREKYNYAVSRAVAPLNILLEYMMPFVTIGGICICMKGNIQAEEIEKGKNAAAILGGEIIKTERFKLLDTENERAIILVKKTKQTPKIYPRNPGTPSKKPL